MPLEDIVGDSGSSVRGLEQRTRTSWSGELRKFTSRDVMQLAAYTGLSLLVAGPINIASYLGSYLLVYAFTRKLGPKYREMKAEWNLGLTMANYLSTVYAYMATLKPLVRTLAGLLLSVPTFNLLYLGTQYLMYNYSISSLRERISGLRVFSLPLEVYRNGIKGKFIPSVKNIYKYMGLPLIAVWNWVDLKYQLLATSVNRVMYKYQLERASKRTTTSPQPI